MNLSILGAALVMIWLLVADPGAPLLFPVAVALSLVFGVMLVIRIGGADMPTVISLLNGYAGLSAVDDGLRAGQQAADRRPARSTGRAAWSCRS